MFNYRDLPEIEWDGVRTAGQVLERIRSGDAVVLSFPETSRLHFAPEDCNCAVDPEGDVYTDCDAGMALRIIADKNNLNGFEPVIEAVARYRFKADIDAAQRRVVIHV